MTFPFCTIDYLFSFSATNDNDSIPTTIEDVKETSQSTPSSSSDCCEECRIHRYDGPNASIP